MSETSKDKIIEKIRKLLALSQSPNENEAMAATEKAQALLAEYNISMDQVQGKAATPGDDFVIDSEITTESRPWPRAMLSALAALHFGKHFFSHVYTPNLKRANGYERTDKHSFVGAPHNVEIIKMLAKYLLDTVERLAKDAGAQVHVKQRSAYVTAFKDACAARIAERLVQRRKDAMRGGVIKTSTGNTLPAMLNLYQQNAVVLHEVLRKKVGGLKASRSRVPLSSQIGAQDGRSAGDRVGLDAQVRGSAGSKLLGKS